MLRLTYSPPNAVPRVFEFENIEDNLKAREAELIEKSGDEQWGTYGAWGGQMAAGSFRAVRVLLWILLRREDPELALDALDFPVSALVVVDLGDDEPEQPAPAEGEPGGKDEPGASATSST